MNIVLYTLTVALTVALFFALGGKRKRPQRPVIGGSVYLKHRNRSLEQMNTRVVEQNWKLKNRVDNYKSMAENVHTKVSQDSELLEMEKRRANKVSQDNEVLKIENVKLDTINKDLLIENHKLDKKIQGIKTQLGSLSTLLKKNIAK